MGRKYYSQEYRERIVDLARSGRTVASLAAEFEPSSPTIRNWISESVGSCKQHDSMDVRRIRRELARTKEERDILLKATDSFVQDHADPKPFFEFIKAHQTEFSVAVMCLMLRVSRSGYYAWLNRSPSRWEAADRELLESIRSVHAESGGIYGAPRIQAKLQEMGIQASRRRIGRLMKANGLRASSGVASVTPLDGTSSASQEHGWNKDEQ